MFVFIYDVYIDVLRKRKGMFRLARFIVHMRSSLYLVFFYKLSWYHSQASILGYYFCYSLLPEFTCNLLLPSRADIFSSILCQKLCHSKSFLYTPIQIILFSSFSQSHSFVYSLPGNYSYKNTEIMNRTELWELVY